MKKGVKKKKGVSRNSSNNKNLIIIVVVLVVLLAVIFFWNLEKPDSYDEEGLGQASPGRPGGGGEEEYGVYSYWTYPNVNCRKYDRVEGFPQAPYCTAPAQNNRIKCAIKWERGFGGGSDYEVYANYCGDVTVGRNGYCGCPGHF